MHRGLRKRILLLFSLSSFLLFFFCLPNSLFDKPRSTVLYSSDSVLLSAIIAEDGQWRFPASDSVPQKFRAALLMFEDRNFFDHNGVYLPSIFRAVQQNIRGGKVVSGASTITMQVVRMSRDNPSRTVGEKIMEMVRALRMEWKYSKEEILSLYASNAPYGGNVVGLDAAAWRYFGRTPEQLSWAESATLAVLPNAPALIFPGKNQQQLLQKRNRLLQLLHEKGYFDDATLELSYLEPLPQRPYALPQTASHLLNTLCKEQGKGKKYVTTIRSELQLRTAEIMRQHVAQLEANLVYNAAVMIVEVRTGDVLAYIGNSTDARNRHGNMVDVIRAPRSTGSILKPFLYAAMLKDGLMLPNTLMPDIPIQFDGFSPKNYSETFDGAVPASLALSRSLNVPAVVMLREYGYPRFHHLLKKLGFSNISRPADDYGLSLILGGAEASLWDITHAYAGMSRALVDHHTSNGKYFAGNYVSRATTHHFHEGEARGQEDLFPLFDAGSIWNTYRALLEVNRPETELGWEAYSSNTPIAWKTGTSFGNRDAWAVGTTPEYVVGVWVGNADGVGRPQLTGVTAAAPILFDVFALLPQRTWFNIPYDDLEKIEVCHESGMRRGMYCEHIDTIYAPHAALHTKPCAFHQLVHTDHAALNRLSLDCADASEIVEHHWFVLPPVQEYYYRTRHPEYSQLPPFAEGCGSESASPIGMIYPRSDARVFIPKNLQGNYEKVVLEATHRSPDAILYWHLDGQYLGETRTIHHMEIRPDAGKHVLTIVDQDGQSLTRSLDIIEK